MLPSIKTLERERNKLGYRKPKYWSKTHMGNVKKKLL